MFAAKRPPGAIQDTGWRGTHLCDKSVAMVALMGPAICDHIFCWCFSPASLAAFNCGRASCHALVKSCCSVGLASRQSCCHNYICAAGLAIAGFLLLPISTAITDVVQGATPLSPAARGTTDFISANCCGSKSCTAAPYDWQGAMLLAMRFLAFLLPFLSAAMRFARPPACLVRALTVALFFLAPACLVPTPRSSISLTALNGKPSLRRSLAMFPLLFGRLAVTSAPPF